MSKYTDPDPERDKRLELWHRSKRLENIIKHTKTCLAAYEAQLVDVQEQLREFDEKS